MKIGLNHYEGESMKLALAFFALCLIQISFASIDERLGSNQFSYYGSDFYKSKSSISKESLFKILNSQHSPSPKNFDIISTVCVSGNCYSHQSIGYTQARRVLFGALYKQTDMRGMFVEDVYCGKKFYFRSVDDVSHMGSEVNIEHTWPQSKFTSRFEKEIQKSDLHHLFLTDSLANNRRANHEFGEVGDGHNELNVEDCDDSKLGVQRGGMIFTPPAIHKGNVARALFYFSVRYQLPISANEERVLRKWHENDPIDGQELERHEAIAAVQLVRNPFIDHPELVNQIQDF